MNLVKEVAKLEEAILRPWCSRIAIAGGIRRKKEDPHDVDFVVIPSSMMNEQYIRDYALFQKKGNIGAGDHLLSYKVNGVEVDIYFATEDNFGAMLLFLTGPSGYNIGMRRLAISKGYKLNQYGLFTGDRCLASKTEEEIYKALGKLWKSPELRGLSGSEIQRRFGVPSNTRVLSY